MACNETCLHCRLWRVINQFCADYPDGVVEDVLLALADVVGDFLMANEIVPEQDKILVEFNKRIRERIEYDEEAMANVAKGR